MKNIIIFIALFLLIGIGFASATIAHTYDNELYTKSKYENVEVSLGEYESHYFIFIQPWGYNRGGLYEDVGIYNSTLDKEVPDKEFKSMKARDRLWRFKQNLKGMRFAIGEYLK